MRCMRLMPLLMLVGFRKSGVLEDLVLDVVVGGGARVEVEVEVEVEVGGGGLDPADRSRGMVLTAAAMKG